MTGHFRLRRAAPLALGLMLALGAALPAAPARAEMRGWALDPEHTTVAFLVTHIGYAKVLGVFREVEGRFDYDPEAQVLGPVEVTVPAASVWTNNDRRDGHVLSPDFLDAAAHPQITFRAEGGTPTGEGRGTVTGDLTVRGVTVPLTLEVTLNRRAPYPFGHGKETIGASARATVMRSAFGMTYALQGDLVADAVEVVIELEAIAED